MSGTVRASLRAAHQLIFLARMTLSQAAEILEVRQMMTGEVVQLLSFLQSQQLGRLGRARERRKAV